MASTFGAGLLGMGGGAIIGGSIVRLFLDTSQFDAALAKTKGESQSAAASGGAAAGKFSMLTTAAYAAAGYAAVKFAASSVQAAVAAEHAQVLLANAIHNSVGIAQDSATAFNAQSLAIARATGVYQENVTAGQAMLVSMHLTQEQVTTLTPLVVDLATKLGDTSPTGVSTAAKAVGKAMEGSSASLSKYGIVLDKTAYAADHAGTVINALGAIQGLAAQQLKAEPWKLLAEQFHELELSVGQALLPALKGLVPILSGVLSVVVALHGPLLAALGAFVAFKVVGLIATAMQMFGTTAIFTGTAIEGMATSVGTAGLALESMAGPLGIAVAAIGLLTLGFMNAKASANAFAAEVTADVTALQRQLALGQIDINAFNLQMARMRGAADLVGVSLDKVRQNAMPGLILALQHGTLTAAQFTHQGVLLGANAKYLSNIIHGTLNPAVKSIVPPFNQAGGAADAARTKVQKFATLGGQSLHQFRNTTKTQLTQSEQSFSTFAQGWKVSSNKLLHLMNQMKTGTKTVTADLAKIVPDLSKTAEGRAYLQFLQTQGPGYIDGFATASKTKQQTMLGDWRTSSHQINQQVSTMTRDVGHSIGAIPDKTVTVTIDVVPDVSVLSSVIDSRIGLALAGLKTGGS